MGRERKSSQINKQACEEAKQGASGMRAPASISLLRPLLLLLLMMMMMLLHIILSRTVGEPGAGWSRPARSSLRTLRDETKAVMQYAYLPTWVVLMLACQSANGRGIEREREKKRVKAERAWAVLKHQPFCLNS